MSLLTWLLDATIKGSVVILLGMALLRLFGERVGARWRHALWLILVARLVLPVAPSSRWSVFNLLPSPEIPPVEVLSDVTLAAERGVPQLRMLPQEIALHPATWPPAGRWLAALWLSGAILLVGRMLVVSMRMQRAIARAARSADVAPPLLQALDAARRQLGVKREVRIVISEAVRSPALHGLIRPTLLVPPALAGSFTGEELRHVMLHELWHLRRFDVAVNWLLAALQIVHWFNPLVWFAASRIREERELACDELALSCLEEEERSGYGRTILKLLDRFRTTAPVPALVGIVDQKESMKRRLMMISTFPRRTRYNLLFAAAVAAVGLVGLTDARGGERKFVKRLDHAIVEQLHQRVSFQLSGATLNDLLGAVASKAGVTITQAPEVATSPAQQARFTVNADNVPAHAVLMETLMPFALAPKPEGAGVTIASCDKEADSDGDGVIERKIVMKHHDAASAGTATEDEKVIKKIVAKGAGGCQLKDGKLRRELTLNIEENGVKSEGKLTVDITAPTN